MKKASFVMALVALILSLAGEIVVIALYKPLAEMLFNRSMLVGLSTLSLDIWKRAILVFGIFALIVSLAIGIPIVIYAKKSKTKNEKHMGMGIFAIVIGGLTVLGSLQTWGLSLIPAVLYILAGVGMLLKPSVSQPNIENPVEVNPENNK